VVESASGLSGSGYTNGWYRKYASGWVEQGARVSVASAWAIKNIIVPMAGSYHISTATGSTGVADGQGNVVVYVNYLTLTSTTFQITGANTSYANWEIKGMAAS
jgi:hypothetical protein